MWQKEEFRLFLTLQHRGGKPGCHWALLLAPKCDGERSPEVTDAYLFHALDLLTPGIELTSEGRVPWRYERKPVNSAHVPRLVARILLARLPMRLLEHGMDKWTRRIDNIVSKVPVVQDNPNWNCVSWVQDAMKALRNSGNPALMNIVAMERGDSFELSAVQLGDRATQTFIVAPDVTVSQMPWLDWSRG